MKMTNKKNNGQMQYCSDIVEEMICAGIAKNTDISHEEEHFQFCSTLVDEMIDK